MGVVVVAVVVVTMQLANLPLSTTTLVSPGPSAYSASLCFKSLMRAVAITVKAE